MLSPLIKKIKKEEFLPTRLSIVTNPVYIVRRGLFKTLSQLAPTVKGDILDFGCGSKPYEGMFVNASSYVGVDVKVSGHDHKDSKVDYFYNGKRLPFNDESFDAVVCFEVLEHVFDIDEVLKEIKRVLKPNGKFLLSTPFAWGEHEEPYDFARYTSFGVRYILNTNGFSIDKETKTTTYILSIFQIIIAYLVRDVLPQGRVLGFMAQLAFIFPLNLIAHILNCVLPKSTAYYSNIVVLAIKTKE